MTATCSTCAFSRPHTTEEDVLVCCRYPPQVYAIGGDGVAVFPTVDPGEWCGEHYDPQMRSTT